MAESTSHNLYLGIILMETTVPQEQAINIPGHLCGLRQVAEPIVLGLHFLLFQRWKFICRQYQQKKLVEFKYHLKQSYHLSVVKATGLHFSSKKEKKGWNAQVSDGSAPASLLLPGLNFFMLMCSFPFCKLALTWLHNELQEAATSISLPTTILWQQQSTFALEFGITARMEKTSSGNKLA